MTDRLSIYNGALTEHLGSRKLSSLSENRPTRRALDAIWNDNFTDLILQNGLWVFATRSVQLEPDPDVTTGFGYANAFAVPDDHIRTAAVCEDEYFDIPLLEYKEEQAYFFSDVQPIYVSYISNDSDYGGDLNTWTPAVVDYAKALLAFKASPRITHDDAKTEYLRKLSEKLKIDARGKDAMEEPTAFPPQGSWVSSRRGKFSPKRNSSGSWRF